jgi:hypothetical protein
MGIERDSGIRQWSATDYTIKEGIDMFFRFLFVVVLISVIFGCRAGNLGSGTGVVSYEISFNTDKNYIINETSFILQLYEYTIEIVDPTKDYYVMQTYWRLERWADGDWF